MPVDSNPLCKLCWYLPFFVTKQAKLFPGEETLLFSLLPRISEFVLSLEGALVGENVIGEGRDMPGLAS